MFDFIFKKKPVISTIKPTLLLVLDGWGVAPASSGNAIAQAKLPNWNSFLSHYPHGTLIAAGESVGLPANEVGNTEVGHLTIGAGRVVDQDVQRIHFAIKDGSFFENTAFLQAIHHVTQHKSSLHLMGLVGSGNVHASYEHLLALLDLCKRKSVTSVFLHMFTDGRDSSPQEAGTFIDQVEADLQSRGVGKIATVAGRYWALDRDKRWERTEKTYRALVEGVGERSANAKEAIQRIYAEKKTDEFIPPTVILENGTIKDNDAVIFFNFRIDRPRQLAMSFVMPDFETLRSFDFGYSPETKKVEGTVQFEAPFKRNKVPQNLFFVTMTQYQKNLPVSAIAFEELVVSNAFGLVLQNANLEQLRLTESEKERFVTYYFSGLREEKLTGEDVIIVPSPRVATYDKKPEMSIKEVVKNCIKALEKDTYHFILINFPNPDIVAHTGNLQAAIKACQAVDWALGELFREIVETRNGTIVITADHGNVEEMLTYNKQSFFFTTGEGRRNTDHSNNPVPLVILRKDLFGNPKQLENGTLSDVAPTLLGLMGLSKPPEMTGKSLI